MPTTRHSRHGSLQYWPRKRAQRQHPRIRTWADADGVLGFAGYKAGMTHVVVTDNRKNSPTKGQDITVPVTIIECPPLRIAGVRLYGKNKKGYGQAAATEIRFEPTKDLARTTDWQATGDIESVEPEDYVDATLIVHTQPRLTGVGQKKPQVFELGLGGSIQDLLAYAQEHDEISVEDALAAGSFVDAHGVTKGKGTQGVVKRFGVSLRSHKSEKSRRKAVIAPEGYGKVQYTAPQAGKMGYHLRTEHNKQIVGIVPADDVQISGGLVGYGQVNNTTILLHGSTPGPKKRLITLTKPTRPDRTKGTEPMSIVHIATRSQQGNQ